MQLSAMQRGFLGWLASGGDEEAARLPLVRREGLAVYQNNYRGSLMACLADSYPQTLAWLGEAAFHAAAARHIDRVLPHSWTLDDYADGFPASLIEDYPYDGEIGELARIEWALSRCFVAEDAVPLTPQQIAHVDWEQAIVQSVPALEILPLHANAGEIWIALAEEVPPPEVRWNEAPAPWLVWRQDGLCRLRPIEPDEAAMLGHLAHGSRFSDLCAMAVAQRGEEQGLAFIGQALSRWVGDGLVTVQDR